MPYLLTTEKVRTNINDEWKPSLMRLNEKDDEQAFLRLVNDRSVLVHDEMEGQLRELIKSNNPSIKIKAEDYAGLLEQHLNGKDIAQYGVWVYYPWSKKLVHTLDEAEFVEVRTNRNRYKITDQEQRILSRKKVGIIGLSVGQSIALTLAIERTCGELRLADYDTVELSNLNRIRTGLHNLGLRKTVIAAREISEIDPYLNIRIFNDGLNKDNIDDFFTGCGKLDLLVEVCDGLDVKVMSRFKARELRVPVVMDTNDRGMLDVERFDLEPERPILHGLAGDLDPENITNLTNEEKIPYILKMIGAETISTRLKASMLEVEQSINTWPQLASSVALGGAITTDVCRNIFLNNFHDSGRYYIDIDEIISDKTRPSAAAAVEDYDGPAELKLNDLEEIAGNYFSPVSSCDILKENLVHILEAACFAPSGGNSQPWKFLYRNRRLYIFHDAHYSYSLLDYNNSGSYIAFGAMLENIELKAASLALSVQSDVFPLKNDPRLVAVISFSDLEPVNTTLSHLAPVIGTRMTNRTVTERKLLETADQHALISIAETIPGARLQLFDATKDLNEFAEILTNTERLRFLHPRGHYDTFIKELRFSTEEVESTSDGMDVKTLNVSNSEIAALQIAKDPSAIALLHQLHKGTGFKKISNKNIITASSIGVVSMAGHDANHFLQAGRAVERIWLEANYRNIAFQPISQIVFMSELFLSAENGGFNRYEQKELEEIHERFLRIINIEKGDYPLFVFRLCNSAVPSVRSLRRPLDKVLFN